LLESAGVGESGRGRLRWGKSFWSRNSMDTFVGGGETSETGGLNRGRSGIGGRRRDVGGNGGGMRGAWEASPQNMRTCP